MLSVKTRKVPEQEFRIKSEQGIRSGGAGEQGSRGK